MIEGAGPADAPDSPLVRQAEQVRDALRARRRLRLGDRSRQAGWDLLSVAAGLTDTGAWETLRSEQQLLSAARAPVPQRRVVALVSSRGGVGTTTTAIGVAMALAAVREDQIALADVHGDGTSLTRRVAGRAGETVAAAARPGGPVGYRHQGRLNLVDGGPWHRPAHDDEVRRLLDLLTATYTFTVLDVGNATSPAAGEALSRADLAVVVAGTTLDAAGRARDALDRIGHYAPDKQADPVIAVVAADVLARRRAVRRIHEELGVDPQRVVAVPRDGGLTDAARFSAAALSPQTRRAYLRLAALVAEDRTADAAG